MSSKIMSVFYGLDRLPYKDSARNVHYPIMESALITGENNTRTIRFFTSLIGGNERQWIANIKKPDGTLAYQLCSNAQIIDGEYCVELDISYLYANQRGEVYIGLQGYDNSAVITYNSETLSYEISGDPTVIATGTIKILVNYAPNIFPKGETLQPTTEQLILASLGGKLDKTSGIIVLGALPVSASGYPNGQLIIVKTTGAIYQSNGATFDRINLQVKCGDIDIREELAVLPTWYYGKVVKGSDTPFADAVNVLYHFTDKDNGLVIYNGQVFVINSGTWAKLVKSVGGEVIENEFYDGNTKTPSHRLVNLSEVASSISVALQSAKDYTDDEVSECLESAKDYTDLVDDKLDNFIATKGQNSGLAPLDSNGKIAISYIPTTIARTSESATFIQLTLDTTTYILKAKLIAKDATQLCEAQVDLPLETMVVSGSYDAVNKKLVLVLKNGQTIDIPVAQLVSGLVATSDIKNNLTSIDTDKPLSAYQGKVLNDLITALSTIIPTDLGVDANTNEMYLKHGSSEIEGQTRQKFKTIGGQSIFGDGNIPVGGGSASIDDTTIATDKTWSSNKINTELGTKESTSNKKTSWGATPSDTNYPSEKLVKTECDNIRAVAEGKCKSYILSYSDTSINPHGGLYYTPSGNTLMPDQAIEYVNGYTNGNALFNSQNNSIDIGVESKFYYIFRTRYNEYIIYKSDVDFRTMMYARGTVYTGDIFLVIETDVPDRWIGDGICYCLETKHGEITFATGTNQGQFKANNVDYSVNGLGTSDSPSFKSITANANTSENKEHRFIIENTTTNESSAMWASDSEGTPFSSLYYGKSSVVEGNDVYDYSIVCSGVEAEADMPKGSLISFQHNVIHEGEPVSNDVSYACCYYDSESETAVFKAKATDDTNYSEIEVVKNGASLGLYDNDTENDIETYSYVSATSDSAVISYSNSNSNGFNVEYHFVAGGSMPCGFETIISYTDQSEVEHENKSKFIANYGSDYHPQAQIIASEKVGSTTTENKLTLTKDDAQLDTMGTNNKSLVQKQYVDTKDSIVCKNTSGTSLGNIKFVPCTTAEYEALATKDSNTLYIITD